MYQRHAEVDQAVEIAHCNTLARISSMLLRVATSPSMADLWREVVPHHPRLEQVKCIIASNCLGL
ncbi:hypothetical protein PanWU01x14_227160 [Parasponia andersonii]|uniref:Uncharacterized protein n=1 Tax=Parasponia andersonii TaxID=3476 RepID=A0A2P5BM93_PARAD|nr:hypothetical protein PanWU01x14_227160 [Parasponia andersonii]